MPGITSKAIVPCELRPEVKKRIEALAEHVVESARRELAPLGEAEADALLFGAVERLRGQRSASMGPKREFVAKALDHMLQAKLISKWTFAGNRDRHDYEVLIGDHTIVIEAKGCLDGNNTNIFQRPANADEFYIWSLCQNPGADPRKNVWSGTHTRLGAEMIARKTPVDGLIVWDMLCGTPARPCPKLEAAPSRATKLGDKKVPPPCLYLFPRKIPDPRNNRTPPVWKIGELKFASALQRAFGGRDDEVTSVALKVRMKDASVVRTTTLTRGGLEIIASKDTVIKRARS